MFIRQLADPYQKNMSLIDASSLSVVRGWWEEGVTSDKKILLEVTDEFYKIMPSNSGLGIPSQLLVFRPRFLVLRPRSLYPVPTFGILFQILVFRPSS